MRRAFYLRHIGIFYGTWPVENVDGVPGRMRRLDFNVKIFGEDGRFIFGAAPDKYRDPSGVDGDLDPATGLNSSDTTYSFAPDAFRLHPGERLEAGGELLSDRRPPLEVRGQRDALGLLRGRPGMLSTSADPPQPRRSPG